MIYENKQEILNFSHFFFSGDPLVVMIAMKMEYVIKAPKSGQISKILHQVGDFVKKETPLVKFEDES